MDIVRQRYCNFINYLGCVLRPEHKMHLGTLAAISVELFLAAIKDKSEPEILSILEEKSIKVADYSSQVHSKVARYIEYFMKVSTT